MYGPRFWMYGLCLWRRCPCWCGGTVQRSCSHDVSVSIKSYVYFKLIYFNVQDYLLDSYFFNPPRLKDFCRLMLKQQRANSWFSVIFCQPIREQRVKGTLTASCGVKQRRSEQQQQQQQLEQIFLLLLLLPPDCIRQTEFLYSLQNSSSALCW